MRSIQAVFFDIDGTLIDTWNLYLEAYIRTFHPHFGRRLTLEELTALRPTSELRLLGNTLVGRDIMAIHREFLGHYRQLHITHFEGVYPGVREMLQALRKARLPIGIVTGKSRSAWAITRPRIELGEFAVTICDEDVKAAKPDPEGLRLALRQLDVAPNAAVYVGDSVGDAGAAAAAGMRFAAALWPKAPEEIDAFLEQVRWIGTWVELHHPRELLAHVVSEGNDDD